MFGGRCLYPWLPCVGANARKRRQDVVLIDARMTAVRVCPHAGQARLGERTVDLVFDADIEFGESPLAADASPPSPRSLRPTIVQRLRGSFNSQLAVTASANRYNTWHSDVTDL